MCCGVVRVFNRRRISGEAPIDRSHHHLQDVLGSPPVHHDIERDDGNDQPEREYRACPFHADSPAMLSALCGPGALLKIVTRNPDPRHILDVFR